MTQPKTPLALPNTYRTTFRRPGGRAWVRVGNAATRATVLVNGREAGTHLGAWTPFEFEVTSFLHVDRDENELEIRCEDLHHTTNGFLPVIGVRWCGVRDVQVRGGPTPPAAPARQRSAVRGQQLLVDGVPFRVRGILHWGYYPELGTPWPDEGQIRRELTDLKSLGFNLVKFCLWVPPPRYYELCDEMGMLCWQEYPVWDAKLSDPGIIDEYRELLLNDRGHACVILRTLTCENDHVDRELGRTLIELARELIPGCVVLDNSSWLCTEHAGDFHDEHAYVHPAQWRYYRKRMAGKLSRPLLLGETMVASTDREGDGEQALRFRRYEIERFAADFPDGGYVVTGMRDIKNSTLGLYTLDGRLKYRPEQWAWHREPPGEPREVPALEWAGKMPAPPLEGAGKMPAPLLEGASGMPAPLLEGAGKMPAPPLPAAPGLVGPRKGQWKCPEYNWWACNVHVLDATLPVDLIQREALFDLLSGRVLENTDGTRVLVEVWSDHGSELRKLPLVIEFRSEGKWQVVSAFRHDTPAGRQLWRALSERSSRRDLAPPPDIGRLVGTSLVLEDWELRTEPDEMPLDAWRNSLSATEYGSTAAANCGWLRLKCDTPLVNAGRNVFEGWGTFRTRFRYPGGARVLRCESLGDFHEIFLDGQSIAANGPRHGTWDNARDMPRNYDVNLAEGEHELAVRVRDWRAMGSLVGPIYLASDLTERIF